MNDQLKEFVEKNRAEFDDLEAPAFKLDLLKQRLANPTEDAKKTIPLFNKVNWLIAAASVLVAIASTWLFLYKKDQTTDTLPKYVQHKAVIPQKEEAKLDEEIIKNENRQAMNTEKIEISTNSKANLDRNINPSEFKNMAGIYKGLKDSSSASIRLLAIIEIEKTDKINSKIMDMLAETMNHDRNTNVRLAALSVLQKHGYENQHVSSILINSLDNQTDPMVQLGLLSLLGKMKNVEIDKKLRSLVNNPDTFMAVRDEAYNILLNQNKL